MSAFAASWNISGRWAINQENMGVNTLQNFNLKQTGTVVKGTMSSSGSALVWNISGTVVGNIVDLYLSSGNSLTTTHYSGTVSNTGTMSGSWEYIDGAIGTGSWYSTSGKAKIVR